MQGDVSVTICQIMEHCFPGAQRRIRGEQESRRQMRQVRRDPPKSRRRLQLFQRPGRLGFSPFRRGIGIAVLVASIYEGKEIDRTLKYLMQFKPNSAYAPGAQDPHWYYGQYYAAQAMWTAGLRRPQYWNEWFQRSATPARSRSQSRGWIVGGSVVLQSLCNGHGLHHLADSK